MAVSSFTSPRCWGMGRCASTLRASHGSCGLEDCDVALDDKGFVTTGHNGSLPLETSVPGVLAIGDVRAGSVKRVGGAIGEGAAVVSQIHAFPRR